MITCATCGSANAEGARFCSQCGASLIAGCAQCGAELPADARFCPACGTLVEAPEPEPAGQERRVVTVLFADVSGSTALGERLDPERLREVLDAFFGAMRAEIEAEGGTVEKFIGDAVMAAFGVPQAHEDDPARSLKAALRMHRRLVPLNERLHADHGVELAMRVGVNTGEVLATTSPRPGEAMVTGDAVNVAARLQQAAEPGQTVVAERTARAARTFRFRELEPLDLAGKSEPVRAAVLVGKSTAPARGVHGLRAPMVGRDSEMEVLRSLFDRAAAEERPHLVTIYGDPGVGKSRLAKEFVAWLERDRTSAPVVLIGRCLPYGDGLTYWPLAELLKGRAGVQDNDGPDVALEKIREVGRSLITDQLAPDPPRATAALARTVGVDDPVCDFEAMEPRQARAETHAAWRAFFTGLARTAPVVTVVEDIHWADAALLDLLEELAERVEGAVLFVCPARPELADRRPGWGGGRRNSSSISLDPLTAAESDQLVSLLLTIDDLPAHVHHRILERAEGNPFFLEEIVRHLIDERRIVREGDRWRAASDIGEVAIPDTVQAVLAARIDLLDASEKRALQRAAVVGRVFWPGSVLLQLNGDGDRLSETLERLEDRELVLSRLGSSMAGEPEYIFKHVLTRDVAYDSLPRRDRGVAHATVADWIERTAGAQRKDFLELLAYHYEEAYRVARDEPGSDPEDVAALRRKTFDKLMKAAEQSRLAISSALSLAERARAIAEGPRERAEALEQVGRTALSDYRGNLAWDSFREAVELRVEHLAENGQAIANACARAVEPPTRWPGGMGALPPEEEVMRYIELGFAHLQDQDSAEHVRLLTARAFGPFAFAPSRGTDAEEIARARADGQRAADIAMELERLDLASGALDAAGSASIIMGHYGADLTYTERRLALADRIDDPWELGDIYAMAAWTWCLVGDYEKSVNFAKRGRLDIPGAESIVIHCLAWQALAEMLRGEWDTVTDRLLPDVERMLGDRRDDPPYFTQSLFSAAAIIEEARGGGPRAGRLASVLRRLARGVEARSASAAAAGALAWIAARRGDHAEAGTWLQEIGSNLTMGHRPLTDALSAYVLAEGAQWEDVPAFVADSRRYASDGGIRGLEPHLLRLEGRAALASGDPAGMRLLEQASEGFDRLSARWERACTDLLLAEALVGAGRTEDARKRLDGAMPVFEELRTGREIERAGQLLAALS